MATQESSVIKQLNEEALKLQQELQAKGGNATDKKVIVDTAKRMIGMLDKLQPELNRAQTAFGGQQDEINRANELRNKLNKVIAAYS